MKDPVIEKLKADAGIVIIDLWRALRHQPPVEDEWQHPRLEPVAEPEGLEDGHSGSGRQSGLCYFHLN